MKEKMTPDKAYRRYDKGVQVNTQLNLYDTVQKNENFFIGKQWEGVEANGLPTPVFNFLKRVALFQIATISSDNLSMQASPLGSTSMYSLGDLEKVADVMNKQFAAIFERNKVVTLTRQFMRNAAVDGDGATYTYFDPDIETGQLGSPPRATMSIRRWRVGTLVNQSAVGAVTCLDDSFESLFAHLLCHTVDTVFEQRGGIAAFGHFLMTNVDEILQESEEE